MIAMVRLKTEDYLKDKIAPFDPNKVKSVEDALVQLQKCSFQGRNLGRALEVLTNMVKESNCLRVLTLSGAMIPSGMEEILCQAIERKIVNVIVSTGANIIHSIINVINPTRQIHYVGSDKVDDNDLFRLRINRVYDTYAPEVDFRNAEPVIRKLILEKYKPNETYLVCPSEIYHYLGEKLPGRSFLSVAAKNNVPVFCGASSDTELALDLMHFRKVDKIKIIYDEMGDIENFAQIIKKHTVHGTIILGGGVPRNWSQQIFPYIDQTKDPGEINPLHGYAFSVRFHTAMAEDGGLSGCTVSESISWGKYSSDALNQSIWVDSTIAFPLVMTAFFQRMDRLKIIPG
jgi:deoxyhypusine synthase